MATDELAAAIGSLSLQERQELNLLDITRGREELIDFCRSILESLVHARDCYNRRSSDKSYHCDREDCDNYISLLAHLQQNICSSAAPCAVRIPGCSCFSASATLAHFLRCADPHCPICEGFTKEMDGSVTMDATKRPLNRRRARTYAGEAINRPHNPIVICEEFDERQIQHLQRQLILLRHGRSCTDSQCSTQYCQQSKQLLNHLSMCRNNDCKYNGCLSAKRLLYHHSNCQSSECQVCSPVWRSETSSQTATPQDTRRSSPTQEYADATAAQGLLTLNMEGRKPSTSSELSAETDPEAKARLARKRAVSCPVAPANGFPPQAAPAFGATGMEGMPPTWMAPTGMSPSSHMAYSSYPMPQPQFYMPMPAYGMYSPWHHPSAMPMPMPPPESYGVPPMYGMRPANMQHPG